MNGRRDMTIRRRKRQPMQDELPAGLGGRAEQALARQADVRTRYTLLWLTPRIIISVGTLLSGLAALITAIR